MPILLSHQVSGRKGEYARASATIIDAFLHSTMYHALSDLEQNLRELGYTKPMLVNHNSGGMAQLNSTDALQTVHSGPVSGLASEHLAKQADLGNVVATDMGGTSFDIGLVPADGVRHYDFQPSVDRWMVSLPMVHLAALGSGGGSVAWYDALHQAVRVGPQSAGSDPGPACYDRGGMKPTVTDADLLLGYLDPASYAAGKIPLNPGRAEFAMEDAFMDHLDLQPVELARLIKADVDEVMANGMGKELRVKGYLPEEFTMLAYGGNGPLHCCGIANHLHGQRPVPAVQLGVLGARRRQHTPAAHPRTHGTGHPLRPVHRAIFSDYARFNAIVEELEARGRADLVRQGLPVASLRHRLELDMRYGNQLVTMASWSRATRLYSVRDVLSLMRAVRPRLQPRFGDGSQSPEAGIRVITIRVASYVQGERVQFDASPPEAEPLPPGRPVRACHFPGVDGPVETPVYDERALEPGLAVPGPAVVTTPTTTYLVEPGWRVETGAHGAIWFLETEQEKP